MCPVRAEEESQKFSSAITLFFLPPHSEEEMPSSEGWRAYSTAKARSRTPPPPPPASPTCVSRHFCPTKDPLTRPARVRRGRRRRRRPRLAWPTRGWRGCVANAKIVMRTASLALDSLSSPSHPLTARKMGSRAAHLSGPERENPVPLPRPRRRRPRGFSCVSSANASPAAVRSWPRTSSLSPSRRRGRLFFPPKTLSSGVDSASILAVSVSLARLADAVWGPADGRGGGVVERTRPLRGQQLASEYAAEAWLW